MGLRKCSFASRLRCGARAATAEPTDRIDQIVQPTDAQRAKLETLRVAAAQAADIVNTACASEKPSPPRKRAS